MTHNVFNELVHSTYLQKCIKIEELGFAVFSSQCNNIFKNIAKIQQYSDYLQYYIFPIYKIFSSQIYLKLKFSLYYILYIFIQKMLLV